MFCRKCGMQVEEGAQFCTSCGAAVTPAPQDATDAVADAAVTEVIGAPRSAPEQAGAATPGMTPGQSGAATPGAAPSGQSPAPAFVPVAAAPAPQQQKKGSGLIIALVAVLAVALVAAGAFFFLSRDADAVAIDESTFPDGTFRAYVLDNYDKDKDGALSKGEIDAVTRMDLSQLTANGYQPVRDLTGIDVFRNLEELDARNNDLTGEVDLSRNENLRHVDTTGSTNVTRVDVPESTETVTEPDTEVVHTPPLPAPDNEVPPASENDDGGENAEGSDDGGTSSGENEGHEGIPPAEDTEPAYTGIDDAGALFSTQPASIPGELSGEFYLEDAEWGDDCLDMQRSVWTDGYGTYVWFSSVASPLGTWHENVDGLSNGIAPAMMHVRVAGGSSGVTGTVAGISGLESYAAGMNLGGATSTYATATTGSDGYTDDEVSFACGIAPDGSAWFAYSLYEHEEIATTHAVDCETDGGVDFTIMSVSDFERIFGVAPDDEAAAEAVYQQTIAVRDGDLVGEYFDSVDLMDLTGENQVKALEGMGYSYDGGTWVAENTFNASTQSITTEVAYTFYDDGEIIARDELQGGKEATAAGKAVVPHYDAVITNGPSTWLYDPTLEGEDPMASYELANSYSPDVTWGTLEDGGPYCIGGLMTVGGESGLWTVAEYTKPSEQEQGMISIDRYIVMYAKAESFGVSSTDDLYTYIEQAYGS